MKTKTKQRLRKTGKLFALNIPAAFAYDSVKQGADLITAIGKQIFIPAKPEHQETFTEAMQRLHLTEKDIQQRRKDFTRLFIFHFIIGVMLESYGLYLLFSHGFLTGLLTLVLGVLAFSVAFYFHFWLFQVKQRKLGCSVSEWYHGTFGIT